MATAGVMDPVDIFYPAKRLREKDFYHHGSPKKWYADWCSQKTADRMVLDSSVFVFAAEQTKATERTVEDRFNRLAGEWSASVGNVSSLTAMAEHPRYREIVSLGWDVVPYLLQDLQNSRRFWFPALAEITTIRPYDPRDAGNVKRMTEAWVKWGKLKRLI